MPAIRAAFEQRGVPCWGAQGNEADDLAATLAVKVASAGHQATIVSTDKGYCQLLSPNIRIRDYFQKRWLDAPFIASEFGVSPQQLPDYWGLAGISSSKVPGVAGIGPKSAAQLLTDFQDLEGIYARLDAVPEKWRKKLEAQQKLEDSKTDVGWGHQIRSYVLDNSRIKDLRTGVEISATQKVLDGDLDAFIEASLKQGV